MFVFCAGMYRACSTWQYDVVAHLLERHRDGRRLGYVLGEQFARDHDAAGAGGWAVLKSHEEHPRFAAALRAGRARAIYAYRDVRDVVYSMLHKRQVSFETFVRQGMVHQILANDRFWTRQPHLLVQRYEDIVSDPVTAVAQLSAHLGITLADGEAAEVAAEYSFEANRRRADDLGRRLQAEGVNLHDPTNAVRADRHSLLHWNHLRQGRVGAWREEASWEHLAVLGPIVGRWLIDRGYAPDTAWAKGPHGAPIPARLAWSIARGRLACLLRCLSLRHPRTSAVVKRALGIASVEDANQRASGGPHGPQIRSAERSS